MSNSTALLVSVSTINDGDTSWVMTSSALVLFMTIPGLSLYYSGMVRSKNVLSTIMQQITICCLVTMLWLMWGYSLSFAPITSDSPNTSQVIGDCSRCWNHGMDEVSIHQLAPTIPESVFWTFQLTFAIITAALICGSFADRVRYEPLIIFVVLWHTIVYCPIAHSVWSVDGFLFKAGVLDFAGGNVVHICSGAAGLATAIVLGKRKGFGTEDFDPHSILNTFVGTCMLWVGWYGFNGGSAVAANGRGGMAILTTQIATATAAFSWMLTERFVRGGHASVLGMVSGAVAGLVAITPAAGFVDYTGAFIIGLLAGPICLFGAKLKFYLAYDDALDAFGVHFVGGAFGGIATGFFAKEEIGGYNGVFYAGLHEGGHQLAMQLYGIVVCSGWSFCMSALLCYTVDKLYPNGMRVSEEEEIRGLDYSLHKESEGTINIKRAIVTTTPTATPTATASPSPVPTLIPSDNNVKDVEQGKAVELVQVKQESQ